MKMNKKGFTLIELLAVIVVLAIIALIATPIVMGTIKKAQEGADARSVEGYAKALEAKYYEEKIFNDSVTFDSVTLTTADYNGASVACTNKSEANGKVQLTGCKVGGREQAYKYANGKAEKE